MSEDNGANTSNNGGESVSNNDKWQRIGAFAGIASVVVAVMFGVAQCDGSSSSGTAATTTETATPDTPGRESTTPPSAKSSTKPATNVLKNGTIAMTSGQSLNLETESIDAMVHDVTCLCNGNNSDSFAASNGAIAQPNSAATPAQCAKAIEQDGDSTNYIYAGKWYCVMTKAGHYAAIQPLTNPTRAGQTVMVNYIVWG